MEGPDAAAGDGPRLVGYFVLNVAGSELWSQAGRVVFPIEAAFDSVLPRANQRWKMVFT